MEPDVTLATLTFETRDEKLAFVRVFLSNEGYYESPVGDDGMTYEQLEAINFDPDVSISAVGADVGPLGVEALSFYDTDGGIFY